MPRSLRGFCIPALWTCATALAQSPDIDFGRDVRPILADRCFKCHGPDERAREAGLRLDQRDSATAHRDSGRAAIVPGRPHESELVRRLRATGPERMPPPDSGLSLTTSEIETLERWIAGGARYELHWAFRQLSRPAVPAGGEDRRTRPIDRFIDRRLESLGLTPSPKADRETLIRRATFDLTGLPPTLTEIDAFVTDENADAFERVIDRLLASPRFGERMASDWLDVARYADTYGYQNDRSRRVWPWRDWVVDAFNANLPYDEFLTWQIAGDMLPEATREQRLATTFCRLHRQTNEGGSVEAEMRLEYVADRTQTFATAFLGLTLECARCHDHKFDPISQREYYELTAFFDNIDEFGLYSHFTNAVPPPTLELTSPETDALIAAQQHVIAATERELTALRPTRRAAYERWLRGPKAVLRPSGLQGQFAFDVVDGGKTPNASNAKQSGHVAAAVRSVEGHLGRALELTGDDPITLPGVGAFKRYDPFTISLWVRSPESKQRAVILHRSRAWTDAGSQGYELLLEDDHLQLSLIHFWPGNAVSVRTDSQIEIGQWIHVTVTHDGSARATGLRIYVNGTRTQTATIRDNLRRRITGGGNLKLTLGERFRDRGFRGGCVDELRVYDRCLTPIEIEVLAGRRTAKPRPPFDYWLDTVDSEWRAVRDRLRRSRGRLAELVDGVDEIMVMCETATPRATFVRARGAYDQPLEQVEPNTPACLPPWPPNTPKNRLGLARWLTTPDHPLTARVAVNRLWQLVFGRGLVATSDNFGVQGLAPSHPELLDWLASEFVASGWNVKATLRALMLSETYQRQSRSIDRIRVADPENIWLARAPRFRWTAEMLRDQALAASGLLIERLGGQPAHPYQPTGLWREKSGARYPQDRGEGLYRRSLYTVWKRTSPPPSAMIFDAAKRDVCVARRQVTNTPLQSLVLLDDPQFVEAARALAERAMATATEDERRIDFMFRTLTSHRASREEREIVTSLINQARTEFRSEPTHATALLGVGHTEPDSAADPIELAAWTTVASTLLSYDATVIKR